MAEQVRDQWNQVRFLARPLGDHSTFIRSGVGLAPKCGRHPAIAKTGLAVGSQTATI